VKVEAHRGDHILHTQHIDLFTLLFSRAEIALVVGFA
jgi:hypothetical protein